MGTTGNIELPRALVVDNASQAALTKAGPPFGMYAINHEAENVQQWDGQRWLVVAEGSGQPAISPGKDPAKVSPAWGYSGAFGGGGGGITPAPHNPGDPSLTSHLPSPVPCTFAQAGDPGAVGAGIFWLDDNNDLWVRNFDNTAWLQVCLV